MHGLGKLRLGKVGLGWFIIWRKEESINANIKIFSQASNILNEQFLKFFENIIQYYITYISKHVEM
jgi:hypothetical protein